MRLAARGQRDMDGNVQDITAADELAAVRRQAARVQWSSLLVATILTIVYVLLTAPRNAG